MNAETHTLEGPALAGGQTLRLPGTARSVSLHEQLYRYADDLQLMMERNDELRADNDELRESTDRLLESREELEAIMESSLDIHLVTDAEGRIHQSNPASASLAPSGELEQSKLVDWVDPAYFAEFLALHSNVLQGNRCPVHGHELHLRRADTSRPPLIVTARVFAVKRGGDLRHLHWILRDVTYLRETEFETQVASMVFKNATEGVMITDVEGEILAVNSAFTLITGYAAAEALGRSPHFLASGHQSPDFYEMFWHSLHTTGSWQGQLFNRRKNGETYPERLAVNAVRGADGRVLSYIAVFSDLSQLPRAPGCQQLQTAFADSLTQVANRQLLEDRLERMALLARRTSVPFSVIRIDIDGFGRLNADRGHHAGDQVLREIATRLVGTVRESDTVARLSADDFVLLAAGLINRTDLARFCDKLLCALQPPIHVDGQELRITVSLGGALFPEHGVDGRGLLASAARALDRARAAGGACHAIHDPADTNPSAATDSRQ